jgi:uncharacterized membrane protein
MDIPSKNKPAAGRYALLDELRGLDLLSMIGYHACWDLIFLFGMSAAWYTGWQGHLWQQSICWVFILLSGFCLPLGHRPLRRGLIVSGAGALVTAVTLLFMPEDRVVFGVLTLLGAAMLITGLLQPLLQKIPAWAGLVVSLLLFAATYHTQDGFWQLGPWQILVPGMPTSSRRSSAFSRGAFSPRITFRCCPGCFCSGQGTSCISAWGGPAWSRCAGRSVRRWAGWADTRWGSICCISR